MIIDTTKYVANSGLAGLGSFDDIVGSFSVGSQSIASSAVYEHPVQTFPISEPEFLSTLLFNLSFETVWRTLDSFNEYTFDTSNAFVSAGFSSASPTNKFGLYISHTYQSGQLSLVLGMINESTITSPISTPAFTFSLKGYIYKDPFAQ